MASDSSPGPHTAGRNADTPKRVLAWLRDQRDPMLALLQRLVEIESPSDDPEAQEAVFALLAETLHELGYRVLRRRGREKGGTLYAAPARRRRGEPAQLLLGHADTVWSHGTLARRPATVVDGRMGGPGVYDMKGGLVQGIFALRALAALGLEPSVTPLVFVNSDEEIRSLASRHAICRLARCVDRVLVAEPSLGVEGRLKTRRKGVGQFIIRIEGRAAHAGLDPEKGASAIVELSHVIQRLMALDDPSRGISVNVGQVDGGLRPNVVAPECRAVVDVRMRSAADARLLEQAIHRLRPENPNVRLHIQGDVNRPPLEPTPGNRLLWELARGFAAELGIPLEEGSAGGGSDGNFASQFAPTLDGLGAVGDGAHAEHEYVLVDRLPERAALLAMLVLAPAVRPRLAPTPAG